MSMILCESCEHPVDSDDDPDCFTEYDEVLCESCRQNREEAAYDRAQESLMSGDTPTFRETYLAAYEQKRGLR